MPKGFSQFQKDLILQKKTVFVDKWIMKAWEFYWEFAESMMTHTDFGLIISIFSVSKGAHTGPVIIFTHMSEFNHIWFFFFWSLPTAKRLRKFFYCYYSFLNLFFNFIHKIQNSKSYIKGCTYSEKSSYFCPLDIQFFFTYH